MLLFCLHGPADVRAVIIQDTCDDGPHAQHQHNAPHHKLRHRARGASHRAAIGAQVRDMHKQEVEEAHKAYADEGRRQQGEAYVLVHLAVRRAPIYKVIR